MRVKPEDWVLIMGTADLFKTKCGDGIVLTAPCTLPMIAQANGSYNYTHIKQWLCSQGEKIISL